MAADRAIGVDLGGTKILAGVVSRDGTVGDVVEAATPHGSQAEILGAIDGLVDGLLGDGVAAVGFGVPLNLDPATGRGYRATNLPLRDVDLAGRTSERLELPAGIENDANAAALAEWRLGAARGARTAIVLTLGTGVGGGVVLDGRLYRGWAELGHMVVQEGGIRCQGSCHGHGHLEALASGTAADRLARELYGPDGDSRVLVDRARGGEREAVEALARMGRTLGAAIGSLANIFNPDLVVVGGGFGLSAGDLVLAPAQEAARGEALEPADSTLRVVPALLGAEAGLVGAALVGFEALDGER